MLMYNAPGGRTAVLRPERGGTAKAMLSFRTSTRHPRLTRDQQMALITRHLTGAGWRVPDLLAAMPDAPDWYFDDVSQVRVDRWARGRVVLLGDAGYCGSPLAGMGTSLSLVGAYVLAGELSANPAPEPAFAAYQEQMSAYVADGTKLPPGGMSGFAPMTATAIRLRALSTRMAMHWPMRALLEKQFGKADRITLKSYPYAVDSVAGPLSS
jgi:2-polyprenyl-6-methoxyphenol hydroxylase-like FAD-dependent oxidoreductase